MPDVVMTWSTLFVELTWKKLKGIVALIILHLNLLDWEISLIGLFNTQTQSVFDTADEVAFAVLRYN
jgi:hypothetical protein